MDRYTEGDGNRPDSGQEVAIKAILSIFGVVFGGITIIALSNTVKDTGLSTPIGIGLSLTVALALAAHSRAELRRNVWWRICILGAVISGIATAILGVVAWRSIIGG